MYGYTVYVCICLLIFVVGNAAISHVRNVSTCMPKGKCANTKHIETMKVKSMQRRVHEIPALQKVKKQNTSKQKHKDTKRSKKSYRAGKNENEKAAGTEREVKKIHIAMPYIDRFNNELFRLHKRYKKKGKRSKERYEEAANCQGTTRLRNKGAKKNKLHSNACHYQII